ncbi:MAG: bactofilin family protein [Flavobacteriales bacterium]|jgi:cytoskeletal protein CcmA (bactofilin family)|nr:polymer-forming cytoskeletal protein [Flavobacteriaceae bacterium]|tara:strand:- start:179 stop:562 length:384 start_codon:yes stop_codon:yes gene_type:complete
MKTIDSSGQYSKIDKNTLLKGSIKAKTDIRIDGILDGDVETAGRVIVGKEATVTGKVLCSNADIEGVFKGSLTVSGTLSLKTGSNVEGEVFIQKLIVDSGAIFNANCSMHSEEDGVKKLTTTREKTA